MRFTRALPCITAVSLAALFGATPTGAQQRSPVYVGARVCARCHSGPEAGHQFSLWLLAKHSMAYATLAKPESKQIAELSGIRVDPQESYICLGCHSSGAQAEDWEKDDTFRVDDGVQCETCHGPGSGYKKKKVMADHEKSLAAGLIVPDEKTCTKCHNEESPTFAGFDFAEASKKIDHSIPADVKGKYIEVEKAQKAEGK